MNTRAAGAAACPDELRPTSGRSHMSDRKLRWLGLGLVATAGAGVVGLSAMMNPAFAHADDDNIGLVIGGTERPIPGPDYVAAADELYLDNPGTQLYPDLTFYQATPATRPASWQRPVHARGGLSAVRRRRPAVVLQLPARFRWPSVPQHLGGPGRRHPGKHDPRPTRQTETPQRCSATRRVPRYPASRCSCWTPHGMPRAGTA